ncbi:MAG: hypothetical protein V4582_01485 [Pseudomonadota bacterium]
MAREAKRRSRCVAAALLALACGAGLGPSAAGAPSTFGPVIGSALLCRSQLDNQFFYAYLQDAFGPAYLHEGGAYWFKAEGSLWGAAISDVIVSDDSSDIVFVGAVVETTPSGLDEAIVKAVGVHHNKVDASAFAPLASQPGSRIVYFKDRSKIFCAKFKPLPAGS